MSESNLYNTDIPGKGAEGYSQSDPNPYRPKQSKSHVWIGGFLLVVGMLYLLNRIGIEIPDFLFSWQMFLIALGVFIGIRKNFEGPGWMILVLIGSIFLINEFFVFGELRRFILPIVLIGSGLFFIFRPKSSQGHFPFNQNEPVPGSGASGLDYLDVTSIFGGTKKKVFSKNFKGGDVTNIFGGSEIDFTQADIDGTAVLDVTALFGGATFIVPSHWNVVSEAVAILGEVKDKRMIQNNPETSKTLVLKGTVIFGGIDIKSY